jgi:RHS repeat-associated protein
VHPQFIFSRSRSTGKERDWETGNGPTSSGVQETGNDYFNARYYGSVLGRFMSPDPAGLFFADPTNPQSMNLYAYAYNNPLINIDPSGMECVWDDGSYDSADDKDTGSADKCGAKGGAWEDPDQFEALQGINRGDWSGKASSQVQFDWLTPSVSVNGDTGSVDWSNVNVMGSFTPYIQQSGFESLFCLGDALKSNGLSLALDAVGLIPEGEGFTKAFENTAGYQIARTVGNKAGYRGVVATQYGMKAVSQAKGGVNAISGALGLGDTSVKGRISTGATIAGFIPGLGTGAAAVSIGVDASKTYDAQSACVDNGKYN